MLPKTLSYWRLPSLSLIKRLLRVLHTHAEVDLMTEDSRQVALRTSSGLAQGLFAQLSCGGVKKQPESVVERCCGRSAIQERNRGPWEPHPVPYISKAMRDAQVGIRRIIL